MIDYLEYVFRFSPASDSTRHGENLSFEEVSDIFSALLANEGFESFVKEDELLKAYIRHVENVESSVNELIRNFPFADSWNVILSGSSRIEGKDWNEEWEKNYFKPIVIQGNKLVIHSSFHHDYPACEIDIVIDPKMAFGTGNHSTTRLMSEILLSDQPMGKRVLDVGTGSGILAILASKLGAEAVEAVEIDENAWENALENVALNHCDNILVILGDINAVESDKKFDRILANINRNVILDNLPHYVSFLAKNGTISLSGFYEHDAHVILEKAVSLRLKEINRATDNNWLRLDLKPHD